MWIDRLARVVHRGGAELKRAIEHTPGIEITPTMWAEAVLEVAAIRRFKSTTRRRLLKTLINHPRFPDLPAHSGNLILRKLVRHQHFCCVPLLVDKGMSLAHDEEGRWAIVSNLNEGIWPPIEKLWPDICEDELMAPKLSGAIMHHTFLSNPSNAEGLVQLQKNDAMLHLFNHSAGRVLNSAMAKMETSTQRELAMRSLATLVEHGWMDVEQVKRSAWDYHRQQPSPVDGLLSEVEALIMSQHTPTAPSLKQARRI